MKNFKIFLLIFLLPFCAAAQNDGQLIKVGGSRPQDTAFIARSLRVDSAVRFLKYATSDSNKVLGVNAQGLLELRTKSTGSGTTTDTASLSTRINERVKYTDTAAMLSPYYRAATATAALATKQAYSDTSTYDATKKNLADTSALLRTLISGSVSGVSSVSATDGNGFDFTITNATSTPNIALDLQADHNFVSDAQLIVLGNTSGTNTGDQTTITGNAGTATTLQTGRTIGILTGDATSSGSTFNGSANNTNAVTLATVNSNVGSFGSASAVGTFTVNAKGLTTASGSTSIQIAESQVTNLVSDLASKVAYIDTATMLTPYAQKITATVAKTASYTLTAAENGKIITFNSASGVNVTVPTGLGSGFNCLIVQLGAGQVTFVASSTTITNRQSFTKTAGQYAIATLVAYASNTFITSGDME